MASAMAGEQLRVVETSVGIPPGFSPGARMSAYTNTARKSAVLHSWPDLQMDSHASWLIKLGMDRLVVDHRSTGFIKLRCTAGAPH